MQLTSRILYMPATFDQEQEKELLQRIQQNPQAFRDLILQYQRLVTLIVSKLISDLYHREDLIQDIFMKVYYHLSGFRFQSRLSTWIGTISYNTCISFLEKKKLVLLQDMPENDGCDDVYPDRFNELADEAILLPDEFLYRKQTGELINKAMESLQPLYRTITLLYHTEGMSYEEIATITQLPMGSVKSYLFRARKKLKEILEHELKTEKI